jgi:hypothetical protein
MSAVQLIIKTPEQESIYKFNANANANTANNDVKIRPFTRDINEQQALFKPRYPIFYISVNRKFLYDMDSNIHNENTQYPVCYGQHTVTFYPESDRLGGLTFILDQSKMMMTILKAGPNISFAIANDHGINRRVLPGKSYTWDNYDTLNITSA